MQTRNRIWLTGLSTVGCSRQNMTERNLLKPINCDKLVTPLYRIDEVVKKHGYEVIMLLPYHCHFKHHCACDVVYIPGTLSTGKPDKHVWPDSFRFFAWLKTIISLLFKVKLTHCLAGFRHRFPVWLHDSFPHAHRLTSFVNKSLYWLFMEEFLADWFKVVWAKWKGAMLLTITKNLYWSSD